MDKNTIMQIAREELDKSTFNNFAALGFSQDKIWEKFEVGIAAGDDTLFDFFKEDIGDFYWSPSEAFDQIYPGAHIPNKELSVLSFGFHISQKTREEQRAQKKEPCMRWMYGRNTWRPFIQDFSTRFIERLAGEGIRAASLEFAPDLGDEESPKYGRASNWSQRHTAYVAGLGTFGLCESLISRQGNAARYTSLILETKLEADKREYEGHLDWCSYFKDGSCRACMKICPANAISEKGHDKKLCHAYAVKMSEKYSNEPALQPISAFWCGLCAGAVPCQNQIPKKCLK